MKKFKFTLQTLLDMNRSLEKQQKNELAVINNRIQVLLDTKSQREAEIEQVQNQTRKKLKTFCNAEMLKYNNLYITGLNKKIRDIEESLKEENKQKVIVQEKLTNTLVKRKSLEKLEEKQYRQYLMEIKNEEEKASSDFVTFGYLYG